MFWLPTRMVRVGVRRQCTIYINCLVVCSVIRFYKVTSLTCCVAVKCGNFIGKCDYWVNFGWLSGFGWRAGFRVQWKSSQAQASWARGLADSCGQPGLFLLDAFPVFCGHTGMWFVGPQTLRGVWLLVSLVQQQRHLCGAAPPRWL